MALRQDLFVVTWEGFPSSRSTGWLLSMVLSVTHCGLALLVTALYFAPELPSYMQLLPQERYGQFCSANPLVRSLMVMAGGVLGGACLDVARRFTANPDEAFCSIPFWFAGFHVLSAACFCLLCVEWRRRGGIIKFDFDAVVRFAP